MIRPKIRLRLCDNRYILYYRRRIKTTAGPLWRFTAFDIIYFNTNLFLKTKILSFAREPKHPEINREPPMSPPLRYNLKVSFRNSCSWKKRINQNLYIFFFFFCPRAQKLFFSINIIFGALKKKSVLTTPKLTHIQRQAAASGQQVRYDMAFFKNPALKNLWITNNKRISKNLWR